MTATYDVTTPVGQTRLLVTDWDVSNAYFQDEEYTAVLNLNGFDVRLAAAQFLDILASNEAMVQKCITTLDLTTDGSKQAAALRLQASELRRQVYEGSGNFVGMFDWAEMVTDDAAARERIIKQYQRTNT